MPELHPRVTRGSEEAGLSSGQVFRWFVVHAGPLHRLQAFLDLLQPVPGERNQAFSRINKMSAVLLDPRGRADRGRSRFVDKTIPDTQYHRNREKKYHTEGCNAAGWRRGSRRKFL